MITQVLAMPREALKYPEFIHFRCLGRNWHLISISTTQGEIPDPEVFAKLKTDGCEGHITLFFSDLTPEGFEQIKEQYPNLVLFSEQDARDVLEFVQQKDKRVPQEESLVVHCDAGVSRSGAVAEFICEYLDLDRERFERENNIYPNSHVKNILRRVAGVTYEP